MTKKTVVSILNMLIIAAVVMMFACCEEKSEAVKRSGFYFDTYVETTDYYGNSALAEKVADRLSELSEQFAAAYDCDAKELEDKEKTLKDCVKKTGALNLIYGDKVNISCGAVTELWGISTDKPRVPEKSEIEKALGTICKTDYYDGDLKQFPDGTRLDFGSVAKGYACDEIFKELEAEKNSCEIVSLGSSTLLYGQKPDGSQFAAAVKNPDKPSEYMGIIRTDSAFISTSGGYERYFECDGVKYEHIIDVGTGCPVETDLKSVTVIVPTEIENGGIMSDFLSTAIYCGGKDEIDKYAKCAENDGFALVAQDKDGNVYVGGNVDFTLTDNSDCKICKICKIC